MGFGGPVTQGQWKSHCEVVEHRSTVATWDWPMMKVKHNSKSPEPLLSVFPRTLSVFLKRVRTKNRDLDVGEVESLNSFLKCHVKREGLLG